MKILVVNNHSKHVEEILKNIEGADIVDFESLDKVNHEGYDAIILSGGSSLSVVNHEREYSKELDLIRKFNGPILGICLGFELVNFALDEDLQKMDTKEHGTIPIKIISDSQIFEYLPEEFSVYEAHRWVVQENKFMQPLAISKDGIEAVKHPKKEIYGVQFHPEVFVDKGNAERVIKNFLDLTGLSY